MTTRARRTAALPQIYCLTAFALLACRAEHVSAPTQTVSAAPADDAQPRLRLPPVDDSSELATGFIQQAGFASPTFGPTTRRVAYPARVTMPLTAQWPLQLKDASSGVSAELALTGASEVPAALADGLVTYKHVLRSADVIERPTPDGLSVFVGIDGVTGLSEVGWELGLGAAVGGVIVDEGIQIVDSTGVVRLRLLPVVVVDAAGARHATTVSAVGCPAPGEPSTASCALQVRWSSVGIAYPAVLTAEWRSAGPTRALLIPEVVSSGDLPLENALRDLGVEVTVAPVTRTTYDGAHPAPGDFEVVAFTGGSADGLLPQAQSAVAQYVQSGGGVVLGPWASSASVDAMQELALLRVTGAHRDAGALRRVGGFEGSGIVASLPDPLSVQGELTPSAASWFDSNPSAVVLTSEAGDDVVAVRKLGFGRVAQLSVTGGEMTVGAEPDASLLRLLTSAVAWASGGRVAEDTRRVHFAAGSPCTGTGVSGACVRSNIAYPYCTNGVCCNVNACGVCAACGSAASATPGKCLADAVGTTPTTSCGDYLCDGTDQGCPTACTSNADCVTNYTCIANKCQLEPNGGSCTANPQCQSGNCISDTCCASTTGCGAYTCNATGCNTTCTTDVQCATGFNCILTGGTTGTCGHRVGNGSACSFPDQCTSLQCVDGVCCNDACSCGSCATGTCSPYAAGSTTCGVGYICEGTDLCPATCTADTQCQTGYYCNATSKTCQPAQADGATCTAADNRQCTSAFCVSGVCCNSACGACGVCDAANAGICSAAPVGTTCNGYLCVSTSTSCPTTCSADSACAAGYFCNPTSNMCQPALANGVTCFSDDGRDCTSGNCVNEVCCNSSCACGTCTTGTCNPVAAGSENCGVGYICEGSTFCPTNCTGDTQCQTGYFCNPTTKICQAQEANGSTCYAADNRDCTSGECVGTVCCNDTCTCGSCTTGTCAPAAAGSKSCGAGYLCEGGDTCPTTCAADSNCATGYFCNPTTKSCQAQGGNGATCFGGDANDCTSGECVSGVCCNDACTCGSCASGTCSPAASGTRTCGTGFECQGTDLCPATCSADTQCASGYFCNPSTKICQAQGANGATCFSGDANDCTSGNCVNGICCNDTCTCGACTSGTCAPAASGTQSCGTGYECQGADTCPTTCSTDSQCASGYFCNPSTNSCQVQGANGSTCFGGDGRDCTSGNCVSGVCCSSACGACGVCSAANKGVCTADVTGSAGSPSCAPFVCDGTDATCPTTCTADSQCASPDYCNMTTRQCAPPQTNGNTCTEAAQCTSGNCVSGVCCSSACGACGVCSVANKGVCTADAAGSAGSPSCSPLLCDGTDVTCPNQCASDSQCVTPQYCNTTTHMCSMPQANGATCTEAAQCTSGDCVGGICCNTACGSCGACTAATRGVCTPLATGTAAPACAPYVCDGTDATCPTRCTADTQCASPDYCNVSTGQCASPQTNGNACTESAQCGSSNCVDGICCNTACGTCGACSAANGGICTPLSAGTDACGAYVCDGTDVTCPASCSTDSTCATTDYCKASQCVARVAAGSSCTAADQCLTGNCADGVCCNSACSGACDVCSSAHGAATNGTCQTGPAGFGGQSPGCGAYVCDGTDATCPTTCQGDKNCTTGDYCNGGTCTPRLTNGTMCSTADQCSSGNCADGVCCTSACSGSCDVCTKAHGSSADGQCSAAASGFPGLTPGCSPYVCDGTDTTCPVSCTTSAQCATGLFCSAGQCIPPQGAGFPCANALQCASGFCTSGVCCNQACTDGCDACTTTQGAGSNGTCTVLAPGAAGLPGCGAYLCDGQNPSCPASCQSDSECATGDYCSNGACVPQLQSGSACASADQCLTGFCAGSVCCTTSCADGCDMCAAGTGQCQILSEGSAGSPGCGAYVCDGTDATCPGSCQSDSQCSSGDYCSNGTCTPQLGQGASCGAKDQCLTGFCSDGVCCNSTCADGCDSCAKSLGATKDGTCTTLAAGNAGQNPSCNPYVCDGTDVTCPTACTSDSGCVAGDYCPAGTCIPRQPTGTACGSSDQCGSGFCVDGMCCNTACTDECAACNLMANPGVCSPATGSPVGMRMPCATDGSSCGGTCDGTHTTMCIYASASTTCGNGSCSNGEGVPAPVCNGMGSCVAGTGAACAPYTCVAGGGCLTQCMSNSDCQAGNVCTSGVCKPVLTNGATCSASEQCTSGFCVDGVCCDSACTDQCAACDLPSNLGTCAPATGAPVGGRTACTTDGSSCGGACDGTDETACAFPGSATACGTGTCMGGDGVPAPVCNGSGACVPGTGSACSPYQCSPSGAGCLTQCMSEADCQNGASCQNGQCVVLLGNGTGCTGATQCESGFCADGVCCNAACTDQCVACNQQGSAGSCEPVMGAPVGDRQACASDGSSCAGTCNGQSTSCAYPTASTTCGDGTCSSGMGTPAPVCDGKGDCVAGEGSACAPYQCAPGGGCLTQCSASTDCQNGDLCIAGQCSPILMPGSPCASNEACSSGFCVDGVCCTTSCTDQCAACDLPGTAGTCSPVAGSPVGTRTACASDGSTCGGTCDGTHTTACTYPPSTTSCGSGTCMGGMGTPAPVCSGEGSCVPGTGDACSPYQCAPGGNGCLTQCMTSSDCAAGATCTSGVCQPQQPEGAACSESSACASGECVDGVCCNTSCTDQCAACNLPGKLGVCSPVTGRPLGSRQACDGQGGQCGGSCDGTTTAACTYPSSTVSCGSPTCASGMLLPASTCSGTGTCSPSQGGVSCAPYQCAASGAMCLTQCTSSADCQAGDTCAADGTCQASSAPGQACTTDSACTTGICSGGVCCSTLCNGSCSTCSAIGTAGTCTPLAAGTAPANGDCAPMLCDGVNSGCPEMCSANTDCASGFACVSGACVVASANGTTCTDASGCSSGFCVDGVCCNSACDGTCDSCDQDGSAGTCTQVVGAPEAGKQCKGKGACGGTCDGAHDSCTYPGSTTQCSPAYCADSVAVSAGACDENGSCGAGTKSTCLEGCAGDHCAALPIPVKPGCASAGGEEMAWTLGVWALAWLGRRRRRVVATP